MPNGFWGKILRVNLTTGKISVDEHDWKFYRTYLGGWGLVAYTLLKEVPGDADPLGPENVFIFAPGIMTGAAMGGSGRNAVGAKSPLTGGFGEGDVGGFWQAELRKAGWDGLIIEGASPKPVYLWIKDDQVEIRDAAHLWGKTTGDVQTMIREELGDKAIRVTQIGPGGENLGMQSCIINDINHAAGRCGLGAVLGAKKLRAVATRGTGKLPLADPEFIKGMVGWTKNNIKTNEATRILHEYGQAGFTRGQDEGGGLPTRNFKQGHFEGIDAIEGVHMAETMKVRSDTCFMCQIACKQAVKSGPPYNVDPFYGGPEYESVGSLGSCCGVDDLAAVCKANELCNAYGIDTIEVGVTIAWAMEAYERGLLTKEDTGGIDLRFGNGEALVQLTEMIGKREGFGDFLANGTYRCAEKLGKGSMEFAVVARKQETPMHDPRVKNALQVGYAISPTGCDHVHNIHDVAYQTEDGMKELHSVGIFDPMPFTDLAPAKMRMAKHSINWAVLWNCVGLCQCYPFDRELMAKIIRAGTGWDITVFELQEIGERAMDMAREFNRRCGQTAADDEPPARFFEPLENGAFAGYKVDRKAFEAALKVYYDMMGWDHQTGAPLDWKLYSLGLDWVVEQRKAGA
jgi:aldehyde:ferredoxin oxidoreductase